MKRAAFPVFAGLAALLAGCSYSFTGSSVPPHLKTVSVALFDDRSGTPETALREEFTNALIDKFRNDNTLTVSGPDVSDSAIDGVILSLTDRPTVIAAGETVERARITIEVRALFRDRVQGRLVFEKNFTAWGEYDIGADPLVRREAMTASIDKITEDILLAVVSGW